MNELIKISENNGRKAVSARELYEYLGYDKSQFARWAKKNIVENPYAIENEDWIRFDINVEGNVVPDYALTIEFSKKCCMISKTVVGEKIRQYFIEVEKHVKELSRPQSTLDILKLTIQGLEEQQRELSEVKEEVSLLKAKTNTRPDYFTIIGYATLNHIQVGLHLAARLGQKAAKICKDSGFPMDEVPDPRFGRVRSYPTMVLQRVFDETIS